MDWSKLQHKRRHETADAGILGKKTKPLEDLTGSAGSICNEHTMIRIRALCLKKGHDLKRSLSISLHCQGTAVSQLVELLPQSAREPDEIPTSDGVRVEFARLPLDRVIYLRVLPHPEHVRVCRLIDPL